MNNRLFTGTALGAVGPTSAHDAHHRRLHPHAHTIVFNLPTFTHVAPCAAHMLHLWQLLLSDLISPAATAHRICPTTRSQRLDPAAWLPYPKPVVFAQGPPSTTGGHGRPKPWQPEP
jgi:hypothetical protein